MIWRGGMEGWLKSPDTRQSAISAGNVGGRQKRAGRHLWSKQSPASLLSRKSVDPRIRPSKEGKEVRKANVSFRFRFRLSVSYRRSDAAPTPLRRRCGCRSDADDNANSISLSLFYERAPSSDSVATYTSNNWPMEAHLMALVNE